VKSCITPMLLCSRSADLIRPANSAAVVLLPPTVPLVNVAFAMAPTASQCSRGPGDAPAANTTVQSASRSFDAILRTRGRLDSWLFRDLFLRFSGPPRIRCQADRQNSTRQSFSTTRQPNHTIRQQVSHRCQANRSGGSPISSSTSFVYIVGTRSQRGRGGMYSSVSGSGRADTRVDCVQL